MEASTTIRQMLAGNRFFVPTYQRAYSWDVDEESTSFNQVNSFLSDLVQYNRSSPASSYYFGHFLFEDRKERRYGVVDGQQRLTTIIIFMSALFHRIQQIRLLTEPEKETLEDILKRNSTYRFETVDYDKQILKDYVIDFIRKDKNGFETESAKRIVRSFDFFVSHLSSKDESYLLKMLHTVQHACCTTHVVKDESEAIQMFIFQNNRGKKPSNLEIIKAQFLFSIHLYGGEANESLIDEIKARFEKIYKSISAIERYADEDDVLMYTLRVHFNSLWEDSPLIKIDKALADDTSLSFVRAFTYSLALSFDYLKIFFGPDEKSSFDIHSLVSLGSIGISLPFIIKAYKIGLSRDKLNDLCRQFASIILRHRLIGNRAEITSRLNDVYQKFGTEHIDAEWVIQRLEHLKTVPSEFAWWAYWNNKQLEESIRGELPPATAKYLLWKYENHLEQQGKDGYSLTRFDKIISPELEHIAPQTEKPEQGYDIYDEEFKSQYIDCLGNYLLLSKSHNCSVGNKPFIDKLNTYKHSEQQREVQQTGYDANVWTRELIKKRQEKIVGFLMQNI